MFAGKKSAQIREILINESAWEEMTCLFAPSLKKESWILKITLSVLLVAIFLPNVAMHVLKNITLGNSSG